MKKKILLTTIIFVAILAIQMLLLFVSAFIPNSAISKHFKESADYLCERPVFFDMNEGVNSSKIDRYADSILLNIAWHYDNNITSVMMDNYYYTDYQNENDNLRDAVYDDIDANTQYMRYWHGSAPFVRIAHTLFNIKQIYIVNALILIVLLLINVVLFIKKRYIFGAVAMAIGLVIVGVWYVPMSLEYTWTFILMLIVSAVAVHLSEKDYALTVVFLLSGMITNYLDFLTTETITLLVPLLLVCVVRFKNTGRLANSGPNEKKSNYFWLLKKCVIWGIGYIGTWLAKWLLTALITGENVMPYITGHIEERLYGSIENIGPFKYLYMAVVRNVSCLFPLEYGVFGVICAVVLAIAYMYVCYVYHGKDISLHRIIIYLMMGIVPFIRYMILHNHSYLHCFFTYRALLVTIMALCFVAAEIVDGRYVANAFVHRRKS